MLTCQENANQNNEIPPLSTKLANKNCTGISVGKRTPSLSIASVTVNWFTFANLYEHISKTKN